MYRLAASLSSPLGVARTPPPDVRDGHRARRFTRRKCNPAGLDFLRRRRGTGHAELDHSEPRRITADRMSAGSARRALILPRAWMPRQNQP